MWLTRAIFSCYYTAEWWSVRYPIAELKGNRNAFLFTFLCCLPAMPLLCLRLHRCCCRVLSGPHAWSYQALHSTASSRNAVYQRSSSWAAASASEAKQCESCALSWGRALWIRVEKVHLLLLPLLTLATNWFFLFSTEFPTPKKIRFHVQIGYAFFDLVMLFSHLENASVAKDALVLYALSCFVCSRFATRIIINF